MKGTFKRVEKKYLLTEEQYTDFMNRIRSYLTADEFGVYTICNIYLDTDNHELIRRSMEKPVYKEKLRLRSYGVPNEEDRVFLEIKKKYRGIVYKRRVEMPLKDAMAYITKGIYPQEYDCQILREIDYMIGFYDLKPRLYLAYDRQAFYITNQPEIRFTVDRKIRSREENLELSKGDEGQLLFGTDMRLIEIKAPVALPEWFVTILSELQIYPNSFSKYGRIYQNSRPAGGINHAAVLDLENDAMRAEDYLEVHDVYQYFE